MAKNRALRRAVADGRDSLSEIARRFGVSRQRVEQIADPQKVAARKLVRDALSFSLLVRPDACENCGKGEIPQAHHEDYGRPLDVNWLCRACHVQADRRRRERLGVRVRNGEPREPAINAAGFGSRLRGKRRSLDIPQTALASTVGITQRHLSKLENDAGDPSWRVALKLVDALDVSLDYLAGRAG